jgi:hypothetical protein
MTPVAEPFAALHLARLRGVVPAEDLGDVDALVAASLLVVTPRGCMLTPEGYERHEELLAEQRATLDVEALGQAYERFLAVNQPMKDACSAWQTGARDDEALFVTVDTLTDIVERVRPGLDRAGKLVPRFADYGPRLEAALGKAAEGEGRWITDPRDDSLHTVWFECHEDFLTTLGRSREEEGSH